VHRGAAAHVEKKVNQGLEIGNSLDWFWGRRESHLNVHQRGFYQSGHGDSCAGEMGKILLQQLVWLNSRELSRELNRKVTANNCWCSSRETVWK
jgi:hypothetical protein